MSVDPLFTEVWYRYEDRAREGGDVSIVLLEFRAVRKSAKCVWLDDGFGRERRVLIGARKQFACPTKVGALQSFQRRKIRQRDITRAQSYRAERALEEAEELWRTFECGAADTGVNQAPQLRAARRERTTKDSRR